jgi:hypothetical protein
VCQNADYVVVRDPLQPDGFRPDLGAGISW